MCNYLLFLYSWCQKSYFVNLYLIHFIDKCWLQDSFVSFYFLTLILKYFNKMQILFFEYEDHNFSSDLLKIWIRVWNLNLFSVISDAIIFFVICLNTINASISVVLTKSLDIWYTNTLPMLFNRLTLCAPYLYFWFSLPTVPHFICFANNKSSWGQLISQPRIKMCGIHCTLWNCLHYEKRNINNNSTYLCKCLAPF